MINSPWLAMLVTLFFSLLWMRLVNYLTDKEIIPKSISRKVIHIGTGPVFVLCWAFFPENSISKYLAALVPFLIVVQLVLVGNGVIKDRTSVLSMARTGEKLELLRGPLLYGLVFVGITLLFWKTIPAVIALMILCGGDGLADLIGTRVKSKKLPWANKKTVAGSIAMFLGGALLSFVLILLLKDIFVVQYEMKIALAALLVASFSSTIVESITPSDWYNLTVPVTALLTSLIIL